MTARFTLIYPLVIILDNIMKHITQSGRKENTGVIDIIGVPLAGLLLLGLLFKIYHHSSMISFFLFLPLALLLGMLVADFFSGLVHYLFDNFGDPNMPILGKSIYFFREHHLEPTKMTESNFFITNGSAAFITTPLTLLLILVPANLQNNYILFLYLSLLFSVLLIILTNEIHKLAHLTSRNKFIRFLQRYKLILDPRDHIRHHAHHDCYYCITTGWLNYPLHYLQLFERIFKKK